MKLNQIRKRKVLKEELEDWDTNAEFYLREIESPLYQIIHAEKLETYKLENEGKMALDLGAGTGYFSDCLAKVGKKAIALDFSHRMLNIATENYPDISVVVASGNQLPFNNDSFDIIIANGVFHHLKAQGLFEEAVTELRKILKTGGVICLFDRNGSFLSRILHSFIIFVKRVIVLLKGRFPSSSSLNEPYFTEDDLGVILKQGFSLVERKYVSSIPLFILVVLANNIEYFRFFGK